MSGHLSWDRMSELVRRCFEERDPKALDDVVREFLPRMRRLARSILRRRRVPEVQYEPDDAVDSAVGCMVAMVLRGRFESILDADGFWALFRGVLTNTIREEIRRQQAWKRGGAGRRSLNGNGSEGDPVSRRTTRTQIMIEYPDDFDFFTAHPPAVDTLVIAGETVERFLAVLKPELEAVARLKLEGLSTPRIALALGISPRTVDARWRAARDVWRACELVQKQSIFDSGSGTEEKLGGCPADRLGR
jgi:RNA polymerase sigma factor (sigma-70 family)